MLEEIGVPYETTILDFQTSLKSSEYLKINPMGKVPAIQHGNVVVTETPAICAYLADAFPTADLAPLPEERGSYYRWLLFAAGPLEQSCVTRALGFAVRPDQEGTLGFGNHELMLNALSVMLKAQPYAAGERFTAVDVYLGAQLQWNMSKDVIAERDEFVAYTQRTHERPAAMRAAAIDDALIKELTS